MSDQVFTGQHAKCSKCGHEGECYVSIDDALVTKLQDIAADIVNEDYETLLEQVRAVAAVELDSLRTRLAAAESEVARLREALERIGASVPEHGGARCSQCAITAAGCDAALAAGAEPCPGAIARAALNRDRTGGKP